jgi:PAS domain S-box-containing protein
VEGSSGGIGVEHLLLLFSQANPTDSLSGNGGWVGAGLLGLVLAWLLLRHLPEKDRQLSDKDKAHETRVKEILDTRDKQLEAKDVAIQSLIVAKDNRVEAIAEANAKVVREVVKNCADDGKANREQQERMHAQGMEMLTRLYETGREAVHATKNLDNALRLRNHLAAAVQSAEAAVWTKNLDGVIMSWNMACERLLGWKQGEVVGHHISAIIPQSEMEKEKEVLETIAEGHTVQEYATIRLHKNGRAVSVLVLTSPIRETTGRVIGASTIVKEAY